MIGKPALVAPFVRTLGVLAGGDHEVLFRTAQRLLQVDEPATRVRRLFEAIRIMASLSADEAQLLAREQHAAIVQWALEVRAAGGGLVSWDEPSVCAAFLERLTSLHVPRSLEPGAEPTGTDEHNLALLLSDFDTLMPDVNELDVIIGHFDRALRRATANPQAGLSRAVVLRDRARFFLEKEETTLARADYRALLQLEGGAGSELLDLRDLRAAGGVIERTPIDSEEPTLLEREAAAESFAVSRQLVRRPAWTSVTAGLRLADLIDLAERARWSRLPGVLEQALSFFDGLPAEVSEEVPQAPENAPWAGLAGDPDRLAKLVTERDALSAVLAALREAEETPVDDPAPPIDGPADESDGGDVPPAPGDDPAPKPPVEDPPGSSEKGGESSGGDA